MKQEVPQSENLTDKEIEEKLLEYLGKQKSKECHHCGRCPECGQPINFIENPNHIKYSGTAVLYKVGEIHI